MGDYNKYVFDLYKSLDKSVSVKNNEEFDKHYEKWSFFGFSETLSKIENLDNKIYLNKPGQLFLYEEYIHSNEEINYPKIGIYLKDIPCDQTVEVEYINIQRTWENNKEYTFTTANNEIRKDGKFYYLPSIIRSTPIWDDDLMVYGIWDKLPNWKELRKYYERTWWFHKTKEEVRDIKMNSILR